MWLGFGIRIAAFFAQRHRARIPACKLRSPEGPREQDSAVTGIPVPRLVLLLGSFSPRVHGSLTCGVRVPNLRMVGPRDHLR